MSRQLKKPRRLAGLALLSALSAGVVWAVHDQELFELGTGATCTEPDRGDQ